ncbi:MAPEG family protein [Roseivivax sp. CAU 1753]
MTPELTILTLAALLQCLQFVVFSVMANRDLGTGYTTSPRDRAPSRPMRERTARMQRALNNHFEGLILFGIAVMVVTYADIADERTALAAAFYLLARILYVPAYYFGLRPWRSLIWMVGWLATVFMLLYALF